MLTSSVDTTIRFLLPCTMNGDPGAINAAIEVASSCGAVLVPLLLRCTSKTETVSLEARPSEYDFLGMVQRQATIMEVPIEWIETSTHDAGRSIHVFAKEMDCSGILLFVHEGRGVLLETREVQYVIEHEHVILPFLVHLIDKETSPSPVGWIASWFQNKKNAETTRRKNAFPRWYPFALLALGLIVVGLVCLEGTAFLNEPMFTLASLLVKLFFVCVLTYSLVVILTFFVETWRQKQK